MQRAVRKLQNLVNLYTSEETRQIEQHAISALGIPEFALMETAGRAVAAAAVSLLGDSRHRSILVLAGKGNNGGDSLVAARVLHDCGANVRVLLSGEPREGSTASTALRIARALQLSVELCPENAQPPADTVPSLCIDAILGTGSRGAPEGTALTLVQYANRLTDVYHCPILSVDIPSGLDASTGEVAGECVRATVTVTLGVGKPGLFSDPGIRYAGKVDVADIGLPRASLQHAPSKVSLLDPGEVASWLPPRLRWANKGDTGPSLIIAGSAGMLGAAGLCSRAAMRIGSGLVYLLAPQPDLAIANTLTLEVVCRPAPVGPTGAFGASAVQAALKAAEKAKAVGLGPGLSTSDDTVDFLKEFLPELKVPRVLDADALNVLARHPDLWEQLDEKTILTPHPGEMARLCGVSVPEVQSARIRRARDVAAQRGVIIVLKGAATVIAHPDGRTLLNPTGNAGMATAGAGDVLTGTITGLLAQGLSPFEAAGAGVFLHGLAGDLVADQRGEPGLLAGEICEMLATAQGHVMGEAWSGKGSERSCGDSP